MKRKGVNTLFLERNNKRKEYSKVSSYLLPMLLLVTVMLSACGKTDVVGKWQVPSAIDLGSQSEYYQFHKDGKYEYETPELNAEEGTYTVKGNTITLKGKAYAIDEAKNHTYKIDLSDDKKSFKLKGKKYEKKKDE